MAEQTNAKKLELRIIQLENALKALSALRKPVDLSAEEIRAYLKVRNVIAGAGLCISNCTRGPEACGATNCGSSCGSGSRGPEACGANCASNCGSRAAPSNCGNCGNAVCGANCASRAEACSSPCSTGGCDVGYLGGGGLERFSDLGS